MCYHNRMPYLDPARQLEYQRQWMARRRADWLAANGPCVDCGTWERLQVDHVDAAIKVTHRVWSWAKVRREAELAKCEVRCHSCHVSKTTVAGEHPHGERHSQSRLTEEQVCEIRASPLPKRQLGRMYGVAEYTIRSIKAGRTWRYLLP